MPRRRSSRTLRPRRRQPSRPPSFIKFGDSVAKANSFGLRPGLMILPFLTTYVVLAGGSSSTTVNVTDPASFSSVAESTAKVVSLGVTLQMGYKGFFGVAAARRRPPRSNTPWTRSPSTSGT
jgi:hypothetical protein